MKVSIIIRTKNEERWIAHCLDVVFQQSHKNIEVIVIDNNSTDETIEKASHFDIRLVSIDKYRPGLALNEGIRRSTGDVIACLSAHCIPTNEYWLENLIRHLEVDKVAGVYGRQVPMSFSSDQAKRDLLTVFGLDVKVQKRDPFFHNANSAFLRETWEAYPFDEEVTNIEDRVWGEQVIRSGFRIYYDPEAAVFHHHGIFHHDDKERRVNTTRILESLQSTKNSETYQASLAPNISALIPAVGDVVEFGTRPLIEYTIERALEAKSICQVVVLTDNPEIGLVAEKLGATVPFLRPMELSYDHIGLVEVLQYSLEQLKSKSLQPDICLVLEQTYPFRTSGLLDHMIDQFLREELNALIPVKGEFRAAWQKTFGKLEQLSSLMPRTLKTDEILISLLGLGFVVRPENIMDSTLGFQNLGVHEITHELSSLEVRTEMSRSLLASAIEQFWSH
jgi:glycosyltransferase involved in cell wall biosynthesis